MIDDLSLVRRTDELRVGALVLIYMLKVRCRVYLFSTLVLFGTKDKTELVVGKAFLNGDKVICSDILNSFFLNIKI